MRKHYSAAAIFAQKHPQGVFWLRRELEGGSNWIVASHDGSVVAGTDVVCSAEAGDELVKALIERYPHIVKVSEDDDPEYDYYLNDRTQMVVVRSLFEAIPRPLKIIALLLLGFMAFDTAWTQYKSYQVRQEQARIAKHRVNVDDLWIKALDDWQASVMLNGVNGMQAAYQSLISTPLSIADWNLTEAGCNATNNGWSCEAKYTRTVGTNYSFKSQAPGNWSVQWNGLSGAIGRWDVAFDARPLNRATLQASEDIALGYVSELQSVLPAFDRYSLLPPEKPAIQDPQLPDPRGAGVRTYPHPENGNPQIAIPSYQQFQVEAPLRSISVLPMTDDFSIDSLYFTYGLTGAQSLNKSMFSAVMKGKFYVK